MFVFIAAGISRQVLTVPNDIRYPNILVAFPYKKALTLLHYTPQRLILDSGAFSAWSIGESVDIDAYADWAAEVKETYADVLAVNLDVIPGEMGRTSTKKERVEGMRKSLKNADYLRSKGLNVMEVFHQDEPETFLNDLLDRLPIGGTLGISPRNDVAHPRRIAWQKAVLSKIMNKVKSPAAIPRMHGLAVTSKDMLTAFPYFSVDSSTFSSPYRYGTYLNEDVKSVTIADEFLGKSPSMGTGLAVHHMTRRSLENLLLLQDNMTQLWAKRGVQWAT